MTVSDTWADWKIDPTLDTPPATATPEIDKELRNIKAQVKANVVPGRWTADAAGLTTLLTSIGSDPAEVVIDSSLTINPSGATYTIPANVTLKCIKPASFAVANSKTLAILGPIEASKDANLFSWTGSGAIDVSASPTAKIPINWYGGADGISADNAAIFTKMDTSLGGHQTLYLQAGTWRIATPTTLSGSLSDHSPWRKGYRIAGDGVMGSWIYIDVGASDDGLTLYNAFGFKLDELAIVGPATACKNGLVISAAPNFKMNRVNLYMGAAQAALLMQNTDYIDAISLDIGHYYDVLDRGLSLVRPANGISMEDGGVAGCNVVKIQANIAGMSGKGVSITSAGNVNFSGSIEACTYPIYLLGADAINDRPYDIVFHNVYGTDSNVHGPYIDGVNNLTIDTCNFQDGDATVIKRALYPSIRNSRFTDLTIANSCVFPVLDGVGVNLTNNFHCDALDAIFVSPVNALTVSDSCYPGAIPATRNVLGNSNFATWDVTVPDGWSAGDGAYTQCGDGKVDTTAHFGLYSVKVSTDGHGAVSPSRTLSAAELGQLKGSYCSASIWGKAGAVGVPMPILYLNLTLPYWKNSTTYGVNDAVVSNPSLTFTSVTSGPFQAGETVNQATSGASGTVEVYDSTNKIIYLSATSGTWDTSHTVTGVLSGANGTPSAKDDGGVSYICCTSGESDSLPPTWKTGNFQTTTDNAAVWVRRAVGGSSYDITRMTAIDTWTQLAVGTIVPPNCTAGSISMLLYQAAGSADVDYYIADPVLTVGAPPTYYAPTLTTE